MVDVILYSINYYVFIFITVLASSFEKYAPLVSVSYLLQANYSFCCCKILTSCGQAR